jgi:hypothetical protein
VTERVYHCTNLNCLNYGRDVYSPRSPNQKIRCAICAHRLSLRMWHCCAYRNCGQPGGYLCNTCGERFCAKHCAEKDPRPGRARCINCNKKKEKEIGNP